MNADDQMKMKMLDELEAELDGYDERSYRDKKNPKVAVIEEKSVSIPVDGNEKGLMPDEEKGETAKKKKPFYMDPNREKQLDDAMQSRANDPILMRGQFAKRKA